MSLLEKFNQGRVPAERILSRGGRNYIAIIHFGLNTFTGKEWGYGDEDPAIFNPLEFDAEQIVKACRDGGITGLVLVCKHHDGFCLWPTKTTEYNITKSPFRGGKGDLVREFTDACRKYGLDMGFYVSPWDRNHPAYGAPEYLKVYQEQLREVYSNYGEAFEAWFDGANGGDGYYGGARETRKIDKSIYYDWVNTWQIIRDLQPDALIFSDIGPDVRWVGNESGIADREAFGSYTPHSLDGIQEVSVGLACYQEGLAGHADGKYFIPPECDVPLRPGWFYHPEQDHLQRSLQSLTQIYLRSVGCGGFLNLGLAPDKRGLLHENDVKRLREFKDAIDALNGQNIVSDSFELSSGETALLEFASEQSFNLIELFEDISRGEAVSGYTLEYRCNGEWNTLISGKAVGLKRLKPLPETTADALRFRLDSVMLPSAKVSVSCRTAPADLLYFESKGFDLENRKDYRKMESGKHIDMGVEWTLEREIPLHGFIYTPEVGRLRGMPDKYRFEVCRNGVWDVASEGEFANIRANPIPQVVEFPAVICSAFRLIALRTLEPGYVSCEQFGILSED